MEQELIQLWQQITAWLVGNLSYGDIVAGIDAYVPTGSVTNPGGYVVDALMAGAKIVVDSLGPYVNAAVNTVQCALQIAGQVQTAGMPPLVAPLLGLKWILDSIKSWELGTDALAWVIDRIELSFGPFEELLDRLITYVMPIEVPSPAEATHAYMQGQINSTIRDCVYQLNGLNPNMFWSFALADSEALTSDEIIQIGYRRKMDVGDIETQLVNHGWLRDWDRQARLELHWEIPTIGDHLHWLSRNVDDIAYVQEYGLLDGFAPDATINTIPDYAQYHTVSDPHGRDFWKTFGDDLTSQGVTMRTAAFHYAAHWIQPSPEQMREFVWRLRPGAPDQQVQFTLDDYTRILTEQDYAPLARQWFAATVHPVPALSYVVGMYRQGVIDDARLQAYHMDLGYTEADSANFVGVDRVFKAQYRAQKFAGWTPTSTARAVALGAMPEADGVAKIVALGSTAQEAQDAIAAARTKLAEQITVRARSRVLSRTLSRVTKAIAIGVISDDDAATAMTGLGFPRSYADSIVAAENAAANTALVSQMVRHTRQQYLDGFIDANGAATALEQIGIVGQRIDSYVSLWTMQNGPRRKHRTATQIVADVANGYYDTGSALSRLLNLGYDQADSMLFLADAHGQIAKRQAQAQAAAQRNAQAAARLQAQLARQAAAQARRLQAQARSNAPRSVLLKWLRNGQISLAQFAAQMATQGYTPQQTALYSVPAIKDVTQSILKKWEKDQVINGPYYEYRLRQLGYSAGDVARFAADLSPTKAAAAAGSASTQTGTTTGTGGGTAPTVPAP